MSQSKRYSIQPRERKYVKGYGFLSFERLVAGLTLEQMKKPVVKEFAKAASKRALQKSAEATGDLIAQKFDSQLKKYKFLLKKDRRL